MYGLSGKEEHMAKQTLKRDKYLSIGDEVSWRGGWGTDDPTEAIVESIEINVHPLTKDGEEVNKVEWDLVDETVIVTLNNSHWAYGNQIDKLEEKIL